MNRLLLIPTLFIALSTNIIAQSKPKVTINHIAQTVVNLQQAAHFYSNIIGLDTIPEPFHDGLHIWYAIGSNAALHIIGGAPQIVPHYKGHHLCFTVASVTQQIEVLKANGIKWEDWAGTPYATTHRVDGVRQIYLQDPDGYWLEINDAKE
jgi:lactoylglutathione lyase